MQGRMTRAWRPATVAGLVALTMAVAACGSDSDDESTAPASTGTQTTATAGGEDFVAAAQAKIDALYAGESFEEPPADSPPPQRGKNIWEINVGLSFPAAVLFSNALKDSAKTLGWDVTSFDAKFSPDQFQVGIRQAIADNADGIVLYNVDCNIARSALKEARAAKITIIGAESLDCSQSKEGDESLFDGKVTYTTGDGPSWSRAFGAAQANWIIAKTQGKAKTILFKQDDIQTGVFLREGFEKDFAACTTCEVVHEVEFTLSDAGPKLQQKAEQALLQAPDANSVVVGYDDLMTAGVQAAIQASGRKDDLLVVAGGGYEQNMDMVRKNTGQDAGYISEIAWEGYAAADAMNRALAGVEIKSSGNGVGLFDADHNLGTSGPAKVPVDYPALYKKAWTEAAG